MTLRRPQVLVVADNPADLAAMHKVLGKLRCEVVLAQSGNEALAACVRCDFALIFLDVEMPGMDGYEVAEWLKDEESTRHIPIIFVTASDSDEAQRMRGYAMGAVDYIEKPGGDLLLLSKTAIFLDLYTAKQQLKLELARSETLRRATRENEARYREALDSAPIPIMLHAEDGEVILVNRLWLERTGYARDELGTFEAWLAKAFGASDNALRPRLDQLYGITGVVHEGESVVRTALGAELIWDFRSAPLAVLPDGRRLVVNMAQDVTSHRALLRAADEARRMAESANRAKGEFLANMSHELRTPLNAVIGLTGLLADSPLGRRQRDYANNIQLSAQALRALIDDILDFSRIEAGELRLEQSPFSLSALLRTTAAVVGGSLCNKPIEALFDVAPDVPDALIGDALRLQQILLNLTGNAVKFTPAGHIVVTVRCLTREGAQVTLQFSVRDTGIGIASEQLGPIFDGFVQAHSSTSRLYGGSGLGLAIRARLVQLMGGQLEVASTLGQGSEFRLRVPLTLGSSEPQVAAPAIPAALAILIIDDHPLARDILTQTCAAFGWQATALASGAAGLAELQRSATEGRNYDLMLLDWRMPAMDGLEMLRQAHATLAMDLPLVVLMASIFELEQAALASDDLYLHGIAVKPMTPAGLFEAVTRAYCGDFVAGLAHPGKSDRRLAGMRLLVAEDNELNQEVIEQILSRAGAEVVLAANGLAAVAALRLPGARFDAVLMDIQMPLMDGYSATRIIREELGLIALPIIAVTAFARPEDREKSRLAGMVGHIVKPLDVQDLLDLVVKERQGATDQSTATPDPTPQAVTDALQLPGLDVAAALKAFGGDRKSYAALLRKFIVRHGGDAEKAHRLFDADDPQSASMLLHSLSGVASILQATEVAHQTAAIERALLDSKAEVLPGLFDELHVAMRTVLASVDQFEASGADA